jgi:cation diffusion facilitator CzcD-associated flavoprotein CzcO
VHGQAANSPQHAAINSQQHDVFVVIIGAGFGGLTAAMKLRREGVKNFRIIERSEGVAGTWYNNRYPGAEVDAPSICYSWAHHRFPWSRNFARQPEIIKYVEEVCTKEDLWDHLTLGVAVVECIWLEAQKQWRVTLSNGEVLQPDIVISAVGLLSAPRYPNWPGYEDFKGIKLHAGAYDTNADLNGRRVAVVGTGSSAVQVVASVAAVAEKLYVYQREPGWVVPKNDFDYTEEERQRLHSLSDAEYRKLRWKDFRAFNRGGYFGRMHKPYTKFNKQRRKMAEAFIADVFKDRPDLKEAVTPKYSFGGKRTVVSSSYYPSLLRDNVQLIPHAVERLTERGVVDKTGVETPVDVLIMATGYEPANALVGLNIVGRSGKSLGEVWGDEPRAYFGITVPDFPNFFMMYGPSTHGGMIFTNHQAQARWAILAVREWRKGRRTFEVSSWALKWYVKWLDHEASKTAWQETNSYIKNARGVVFTQWPWDAFAYLIMTRTFGRIAHKIR